MLNFGNVVLLERDEVESAVRGKKILCVAAQAIQLIRRHGMEKYA